MKPVNKIAIYSVSELYVDEIIVIINKLFFLEPPQGPLDHKVHRTGVETINIPWVTNGIRFLRLIDVDAVLY